MSVAATIGMLHVCPMVTGIIPHVGGPVLVGMPNLLINAMPTAVEGSLATCVGPPDAIAVGLPLVLVSGMPIAVLGSTTVHGGAVVLGMPDYVVG